MKVEVYDNFEELQKHQREWDDFVESVGGEIFLTYDWCRVWWKYYGKNRDLRLFIFRDDGNLIGILPIFFERIWLGPVFVRAVKIVGSDFTLAQFSLPIQKRYLTETIRRLFETISKYNWDIMHIGPIAGLYNCRNDLADAFNKFFSNSHSVMIRNKNVQTYFELPDSKEVYISRLTKNERKKIRKSYKRISNESNKPIRQLASKENFKHFFDEFVQMHTLFWKESSKSGHFGDWPHAYEFHRDVAEKQFKLNRLRLLKVQLGDRVLGYKYGYKLGSKHFAFLDARSTHINDPNISIGRILFIENIETIIAEGSRYMDSMRGKYEHKLRLGGKLFPIRSIYIFPKKLSVSLRVSLFRALASFLNLCYYRIWYCRIAPKLPFRRRALWKIWIRTCEFA